MSKYALYEKSVQDPLVHVEFFRKWYRDIRGSDPKHLREDFCGTFWLSCEWVKHHPENTAICLDLDPEPLEYGKKVHWKRLKPHQRKRVTPFLSNVLKPTRPQWDLIAACNFSFFVFKERRTLIQYFKTCLKSLNQNGLLILEMAGGPGMITQSKERKTVQLNSKTKFTYTWDQKAFDPITREAQYSIHFKLPEQPTQKDAFTYDWRLWTLPEVREALLEAGFKKCIVFWETEHQGKGTGEFLPLEHGDNAHAWIAYAVGVK